MIQPAFEISDIHVVATLRKIGCIFLLQKWRIGYQICTSVSNIWCIYSVYLHLNTYRLTVNLGIAAVIGHPQCIHCIRALCPLCPSWSPAPAIPKRHGILRPSWSESCSRDIWDRSTDQLRSVAYAGGSWLSWITLDTFKAFNPSNEAENGTKLRRHKTKPTKQWG